MLLLGVSLFGTPAILTTDRSSSNTPATVEHDQSKASTPTQPSTRSGRKEFIFQLSIIDTGRRVCSDLTAQQSDSKTELN
ncbi:hypothetical protein TNCV_3215441 [Trichonephila clavipes]|nr:hypothetical protein TNCV_3215441 [Trichonephila clavipes]